MDLGAYIGNKIRYYRNENKMTQDDLAKKVGVTRQTIGMIENGKFNPSLALCIAICKALGKTLNDLDIQKNLKHSNLLH